MRTFVPLLGVIALVSFCGCNNDTTKPDGGSTGGGSGGGSGGGGMAGHCGDGIVENDEVCDPGIADVDAGGCPTSCHDTDACTTDTLLSAGTCAARCSFTPITAAVNGDGCCPAGTSGLDDDDCPLTLVALLPPPDAGALELGQTFDIGVMVTTRQTGVVGLDASVLDAGWTVAMDPNSLTFDDGGVGSAVAHVTIPTLNLGLSGGVDISASGPGGSGSTTIGFTVLPQYSIDVFVDGGECIYPPAGTTHVTVGTTVRFVNRSSGNLVIHTDGDTQCPHQQAPSLPGGAYTCLLTTPGMFDWYCHNFNLVQGRIIEVDP